MTLKNPLLLIEVLSKVTEGYNRGSKFEMYRSIPTLIEYLMVHSQRVHVELWRKEHGTWLLASESNDLNTALELKSIQNSFLLDDFYFRAIELIDEQKEIR
jgi:Uma2 family endonuclease